MKRSAGEKRRSEKALVSEMIALYCRKQHSVKTGLCPVCAELAAYADARIERCPFIETKTFCSKCTVHCYQPEMREKIRAVMRFSGPRIVVHHPVVVLRHMLESKTKESRIKESRTKKGNGADYEA